MAFENVPMSSLNSTWVSEAGYDAFTKTLVVKFRKGGSGAYHGVSEEDAAGLLGAASVGKYLRATIIPKYGFETLS